MRGRSGEVFKGGFRSRGGRGPDGDIIRRAGGAAKVTGLDWRRAAREDSLQGMSHQTPDHGPSPFPGLADDGGPPPGLLLLQTRSDPTIVLVRIMVGWVFAWEGLLKFLLPSARGAGAFERWGFPLPDLLGPFVGAFELGCGLLILFGIGVRVAVLPLLAVVGVALVRVKIPLIFSDGLLTSISSLHLDVAMLLGGLFLLVHGAGPWSVDHRASGTPFDLDGGPDGVTIDGTPSLDE